MEENKDIRWQQRLSNYKKALVQLNKFVDKGQLNELEAQGLIQSFEYTFELAWNVMKDFLEFQGKKNIYGSRDAIQGAFRAGLLEDGEGWMQMFKDRNETSHTYNQEVTEKINSHILKTYHSLLTTFKIKMEDIQSGQINLFDSI